MSWLETGKCLGLVIAHGPQQVNNGDSTQASTQAGTHAHAENIEAEKNELLEHQDGNAPGVSTTATDATATMTGTPTSTASTTIMTTSGD